tara:strand:+ start:18585 stop:20354 length:1770 start_codon:yes stop_codon:yes gene_type:complete
MSILVQIRDVKNGWIEFVDPIGLYLANSISEVKDTIRKAEKRSLEENLWMVGFLSYEASKAFDEKYITNHPNKNFPLAWFALFDKPIYKAEPFFSNNYYGSSLEWIPEIEKNVYLSNIQNIKNLIRSGQTYQVNYSYRLNSEFIDYISCSRELFSEMIKNQPIGYGAYIETENFSIASASNEIFFEKNGSNILCRPMKGTVSRGYDLKSDNGNSKWLIESEKNKAENLMITDMVRNDLGKFSNYGSVDVTSLFEIEKYPTLWQMTSSVKAKTSANLLTILTSLFPAASITGAPKHRTMEIISNLESSPREIYTGSVGLMRPDGSCQFNVAIRTAWFNNITKKASYSVGGGIVIDSQEEEEWQECNTKSIIIKNNIRDFNLLETIKWDELQGFYFLQNHLERLKKTSIFFGRPFDSENIIEKLNKDIDNFNSSKKNQYPLRIRLLLDTLGLAKTEISKLDDFIEPYNVLVSNLTYDVARNTFIANKTTNRKIYEDALIEAKKIQPSIQDVIIINKNMELTESTIANLFVEVKGKLLTPPEISGLLPGIYRQHLLDTGKAEEEILNLDILDKATNFFLANSVRGLWPINIV